MDIEHSSLMSSSLNWHFSIVYGDVFLDSFNMVFMVMNTAFKTHNMKSESFGIFTTKILKFKSDLKIFHIYIKEIQHITRRNSILKLGFSATVVLVGIFV